LKFIWTPRSRQQRAETPAASKGAAPDESEMVTKEIGKKKPRVSEDSEDIDLELDLEDLE